MSASNQGSKIVYIGDGMITAGQSSEWFVEPRVKLCYQCCAAYVHPISPTYKSTCHIKMAYDQVLIRFTFTNQPRIPDAHSIPYFTHATSPAASPPVAVPRRQKYHSSRYAPIPTLLSRPPHEHLLVLTWNLHVDAGGRIRGLRGVPGRPELVHRQNRVRRHRAGPRPRTGPRDGNAPRASTYPLLNKPTLSFFFYSLT